MAIESVIPIRVRYYETDGQNRVHHAQYLNYFERGRVELLREMGHSYRDFEASGFMLVVAEMNIQYHAAAEFDDLLSLRTTVDHTGRVRIKHSYELTRPSEDGKSQLIVTARTTIACIGKDGKLTALPDYMRP